MIDVVLAFLAGWFLSWPALIGLCVVGILFEHNEVRGGAVFTAIVAGITAFFFFSVPLLDLAIYAALYMVIGFVWSFWRYRRFVAAKVAYIKENISDKERRKQKADELAPKNHIDTIVCWVIVWPFSAIENLTSDLIDGVTTLVKTTFKAIYNKIYTSAVSDLTN